MNCHDYQILHCKHLSKPILNVGCKEDPAKLGELYEATNLDLLTFDPHTGIDLRTLPNFIQGSADALPFDDKSYGGIVIGELLEHCEPWKALQIVHEARRVLTDDGQIIITLPLDDRPKNVQHSADKLVLWSDGITSWHQTVWEDGKWAGLLAAGRLQEIHRLPLSYPGMERQGKNVMGWGICLGKVL